MGNNSLINNLNCATGRIRTRGIWKINHPLLLSKINMFLDHSKGYILYVLKTKYILYTFSACKCVLHKLCGGRRRGGTREEQGTKITTQ